MFLDDKVLARDLRSMLFQRSGICDADPMLHSNRLIFHVRLYLRLRKFLIPLLEQSVNGFQRIEESNRKLVLFLA